MKNSASAVWAAGTYTGTTVSGAGSFSDNIAACNNGGTFGPSGICNGKTLSYPAKVQTDAAAVGISLTSSCTGTTSEIIPLFVSTYSACTGLLSSDSTISGCAWTGNSNPANTGFQAPTAANDTAHGMKLTAPSAGGSIYRFVMDPSEAIGATSGSTCAWTLPPRFGFRKVQ